MANRGRIAWFLSLLLLVAGIIGSGAVLDTESRMLGDAGWSRISVSAGSEKPFSRIELDRAQKELGDPLIAAVTSAKSMTLSSGSRSIPVSVQGVYGAYGQFLFHRFIQGGFFTDAAMQDGEMVAVIGSDCAWQLFLTTRAAGIAASLDDRRIRIVGVYDDGHGLLDAMITTGVPRVYVPWSWLEAEAQSFASFQVAGVAREDLERALQSAGRDPGSMHIVDFTARRTAADQRVAILLFLCSLFAAILLVSLAVRAIRGFTLTVREEMKDYWFWQAVARKRREVLFGVLWLLGTAGGLYVLWRLGRFSLSVPAQYIPDRLIDLGYYVDLIKKGWQTRNLAMGLVPAFESQIVQAGLRLQNWLLAFGLVGLAGLVYVSRVRKSKIPEIWVLAAQCAASIVITLGVSVALGLGLSMGWKGIALVWALCGLVEIDSFIIGERGLK